MTSSNAYTGSQSVRENTLVKSHAYCQQSFSQHTSYISRLLSTVILAAPNRCNHAHINGSHCLRLLLKRNQIRVYHHEE